MTLSRWKIMACILGLSVGGLAVCVGQSNNQLQKAGPKGPQGAPPSVAVHPDKPPTPPIAPDTLSPRQATTQQPMVLPPVQEFELELPMPPQTQAPAIPTIDVIPPQVGSSIVPVVHQGRETLPTPREVGARVGSPSKPAIIDGPPPVPAAKVEVSPLPNPTIPLPPSNFEPIAPVQRPAPASGNIETRPDPLPTPPVGPLSGTDAFVPPAPVAPAPSVVPPPKTDPRPTPAPQPIIPPPAPLPNTKPVPPVTAVVTPTQKLKMLLRMGVGNPRFEIRNATGEELLLKVNAEKIEMKTAPEGVKASPLAGVTACGKVKFTGPGIEGTCDELSILSGTGEVMLKGNVHMKTKVKAKSWSEMTADKMIYQIGSSGITAATSTSSSTFIPVQHQETR